MTDAPVTAAVEAAGKTAGMIVDYGMLTMVGVLFLACGAVALWLVARFYNRKLSGEYIEKGAAEEFLRKTKPQVLRLRLEDLPDLRNHRFFTEATRQMRFAEQVTDQAERDLAVWTIRAQRDAFTDLVVDAYENKDGFDAFIGDAAKFRHRVDSAVLEVQAAVRYRLVEEFGFPQQVFAAWLNANEASADLMANMLDLASERPTPYDRLQAALDSQYARVLMLRRTISAFMASQTSVSYNPPGESSHSTMQAMPTNKNGYPAALFERKRR